MIFYFNLRNEKINDIEQNKEAIQDIKSKEITLSRY